MNKIFLIIILIFSSNCFSQVIKGKVVDSKTKENLSFASISIHNKPKGTRVDTLGNFLLEIEKGDSIVISTLGYPSSIINNCNPFKDTIDLGDIVLINVMKEPKPIKKKWFKKNKKYWQCCTFESIPLKDLKEEDLTVKCATGQIKYTWKFKGGRYLELDFEDINLCD